MGRRAQYFCEWCIKKVKKGQKVCAECLPDWQEHEAQLAPIRAKAAGAKAAIDASKEARAKLDEEVKLAEATVRHLKHQQQDHDDEISSELALALGIGCVELGHHTCEHSPTGRCFYDDEDYAQDFCLMCGSPDERK